MIIDYSGGSNKLDCNYKADQSKAVDQTDKRSCIGNRLLARIALSCSDLGGLWGRIILFISHVPERA